MTNDQASSEETLPPVSLPEESGDRRGRLVLTIIFHPDSGRIGETAVLPRKRPGRTMLLGRREPVFARAVKNRVERPLADPHVSRSALTLEWRGSELRLARGHDGARSRVDGVELTESIDLDQDDLLRGVSIWLGHSVVQLLRMGQPPEQQVEAVPGWGAVGSSPYSTQLRQQVADVARSGLDVLILGETGTGKELVAKAIHAGSDRATGDLVAVNVAAIPEDLAPAELFGTARGAYTGADRARPGFFAAAEGGTLFLDEVGDIAPGIQPQLLRALQEREVQVVGGTLRKVDVRVVAATDAPVDDGRSDLRAALRHRLGAIEIRLRPLRDHPEDIGELWWHFLAQEFARAGREHLLPGPGTAPMDVARWADLFHRCLRYHWPGNVREMINRARQVAVASGDCLEPPESLYTAFASGASAIDGAATAQANPDTAPARVLTDVDDVDFAQAWEAAGFEVAAAARLLGVSRQSVYRRVERSPELRMASDVDAVELASALKLAGGNLRRAAMALRVSAPALQARARQLGLLPRGSGL